MISSILRHLREGLSVRHADRGHRRDVPGLGPWAVLVDGTAYGRISLRSDAQKVADELDGEVVAYRGLSSLAVRLSQD